ncbi:hybrid sensor histidine kinase/response regulator [Caballeronia sp. GAFFF1]|uniref:ATP-binding response regulator n=1 Tax=Caballeronia sp. GAFFF1 TaxID=2921779 RepID=UPI002027ED2D|nr:hybrid sensor histidine kinase/response regulator [Caballeronia sp. GAFFF1]
MKKAAFTVRRFRHAPAERSFLADYARRFAIQRRWGAVLGVIVFPAFMGLDWYWWMVHAHDPSIFFQNVVVRLIGTVGIAAATLKLLFSRRAYDERSAVCYLTVGTFSGYLVLLLLLVISPTENFRVHFAGLLLALFVFFTLFRLRAIVAIWQGGLMVAAFVAVELYLCISKRIDSETVRFDWIVGSIFLCCEYLLGVAVCVQLELAARRDFLFRRSLRASKARVDVASHALRQHNQRMREILAEKERFFSAAYHDIQQPLAAINLFVRSARIKSDRGEEIKNDLDVIQETARDIQDMFKDIQDYSELGSYIPHLAPIDLYETIMEVREQYRELAKQRGLQFRVSGRGRRPTPIQSDRSLLKRALSNLISNAIKNTVSGGVGIGWIQVGDRVRIDVWDTGIGIAPQHWNAIFNEYFQVANPGRDRSKGLGLGLSIVRRVVSILPQHSMRFNSVEGRGSRFMIYVPVAEVPLEAPSDGQRDDLSSTVLEGRYVLLCDDEPTVLEGLRNLFASAGALVDTADSINGIDAILIENERVPDVAVLDIRLGDGSTGLEGAARIRRRFAWSGVIPIAFVTGELSPPCALEGFAEPFELLRKSSSPEIILRAVSHLATTQPREGSGHVCGPIP